MKFNWRKNIVWIIITVVFLSIILVVSRNNIIETVAVKRRIKEMKKEYVYYREKAKEDSTFLENLKEDWFLEKYARETFYMKAEGEEIYLIQDKK